MNIWRWLVSKSAPSNTQQSSSSVFNRISDDLAIYIFSRLPVKSIAKCRCVSKRWSSIIRRPNFNLLFPVTSRPTPPQFLFAIKVKGKLFFNTSPQPQDPDENSSLVATHHRTNSSQDFYKFCCPVHGLVCRQHVGKNYTFAVVSNPITGQSLVSPKLRVEEMDPNYPKAAMYFGYDPIEKQFKVLCMSLWRNGSYNWSGEYKILTIEETENGNLLWRTIQCGMIHYPLAGDGICINGVLYYLAKIDTSKYVIFCFDVRSEEFGFINVDQVLETKMLEYSVLINYGDKGKLGVFHFGVNGIVLWVLEDAEKHEWLKRIYQMPHPLENSGSYVYLAGMTSNGEIVLYSRDTRDPYFIFYYNLEKSIITRVRVEVPVFEKFQNCTVYAFSNYVENVELIM